MVDALSRLDQWYQRLGATEYDCAAPGFDYSARLRVDRAGFVTHYPDLWILEEH